MLRPDRALPRVSCPEQKTAIAVAFCKAGRGQIKINGCPLELVEPAVLRFKVNAAPPHGLGPRGSGGARARGQRRGLRDCYPSAGAAAAQERGDRTGGREDVGACVPRLLCAMLRAALASCEGPSLGSARAMGASRSE